MAVSKKVAVIWNVAPCRRSDDGGNNDLGNVCKFLPDMALQPIRQPSKGLYYSLYLNATVGRTKIFHAS